MTGGGGGARTVGGGTGTVGDGRSTDHRRVEFVAVRW